VARCARPLEREENNPQRFLAVEEKVLGNFIQMDVVSRGTGSLGKKSSRHGFAARAIFPSDGGKVSHWLVSRVSRLFRRDPSRVRNAEEGEGVTVSALDNALRSYIRDRSSFIVVWRIFGDSLLSTYLSSGETLDRLSMANESFTAPGEKETER